MAEISKGAASEDELFQVVGADYKTQETLEKKGKGARKGFPIFSILLLSAIVLGCLAAPLMANHNPSDFYLMNLNEPPGREFFFGTDSLGRDIYSMIWYGGRASIAVGLMSMAIITVLGIVYGCVSGVSSPWVDALMMRVMELANSIPTLLVVLLLGALIPKQNVFTLSILIGCTGWFGLARIVRSEVRQIRNSEYVLAARCMGVGFGKIMWRHLIPNFLSAILFVVISSISSSMSMESTLSFLGLGLPVDQISWGSMLSLANRALLTNTWWVIVIPGIFLLLTLGAITSIGNYFRKEVNKGSSNL